MILKYFECEMKLLNLAYLMALASTKIWRLDTLKIAQLLFSIEIQYENLSHKGATWVVPEGQLRRQAGLGSVLGAS